VRCLGLLLLVLLAAPARADPAGAPAFDAAGAAQVYAAALGFIAPRALEPASVPELTLWGLRGLTTLDPDLTVERVDATMRVLASGRELRSVKLPDPAAPVGVRTAAWARAAAALSGAAWTASPSLRRVGTQGVVQAFFDEMLTHLDPYSRYVPPAQAAADDERRAGAAGVGLVLTERNGAIVVTHAIGDGPAAHAGVREGDRILAVDGQKTRDASRSEVEDWITGSEETAVTLDLQGAHGRRHLTLMRAQVPDENVFSARAGSALVLRVTDFTARTASRLTSALETGLAGPHPPEGIVLDLRGNRGGLLRQAVTAADALLPAGVVAVTAGRDPAANRVWRSGEGEVGSFQPVVVMVDGHTASAAEILAAALADRGRAVVVGSSTFGKGLVQTITRLPDGGELVLTWSRVLAPRGWPIQGLGVLPQVCTSRGRTATERQLAELAGGTQPMEAAIARARDARAPVPPAGIVLIRDACPAAGGTDLDLRVARELTANPAAYAAALLPPLPDTVSRAER
jgi:carboxyl-terminal processing protease